ncbi:hypothetical protein LQ757_05935 [Agromyces sp. SYSU K20354]|uniref:hypothetical protein n=1 Tax=Agromyces cavernae TaxID=2898659 RepID=UPI001E5A330D|nr:hypothetical protein [Agromyces cavernae]MCD2441816.1 hypothetical protein [Agromyces cavernae]
MMKTRTGRVALTALLTLSAFALVGCTAAAADEPTPTATATVKLPTAQAPTPTSTAPAPTPQPADAAPAAIVYGADVDLDTVEYPDTLQGDELANAREWMETNAITAQCMKEKGYDYTFIPYWAWSAGPSWIAALPEDQQAAAGVALDGTGQTPGDYRWEDAGCWGYAVHVMGNDDAH